MRKERKDNNYYFLRPLRLLSDLCVNEMFSFKFKLEKRPDFRLSGMNNLIKICIVPSIIR